MIKNALRTLAFAAPLTLALAVPAHAATYPPDTQALILSKCELDNFELTFDGLLPGSSITIHVQFGTSAPIDTTVSAVAGGSGGTYKYTYTVAYPKSTNKVQWNAKYTVADGTPGGAAKDSKDLNEGDHPATYYRKDCPDLPVTGGNAAPVGKIALGAVLAGGLLTTVAVRRRPRKAQPAA